jgi:sterol desaturase/sphingolipid hydroxylase (fatty acid hydroxylase superfamily)
MVDWAHATLSRLLDLTGSPITLLYAAGLSLSGAGIGVEIAIAASSRRRLYGVRDTLANLILYGGYFAINLWWARETFRIYSWAEAHAVAHVTIGGWHIGQNGLWKEWVALIVAEDLCFYAFHRASHRCRMLWASHVTHHSSSFFNLSVAFRQTWMPFLGIAFWLPLPLVGFDPLMVMSVQVFSLFYQELLHTSLVPKLGPLEWILNTPSHHALHHASNAEYLDKNYGGVLIVWDRLFGTFAARSVAARFGLTKPVRTHNPVVLAFHEWAAMARDIVRGRSWRARLAAAFGPPR